MAQEPTLAEIVTGYLNRRLTAGEVRDALMDSPKLLWRRGSAASDKAARVLNLMFVVLDGAILEDEARSELRAMMQPRNLVYYQGQRVETTASSSGMLVTHAVTQMWVPAPLQRSADLLRPAATSGANRPIHRLRHGPFPR